jgi:type VI secretion system protein ImpM
MTQYALPETGLDVPAWFGKLPGMGDFAQRRLAPEFLEVWDQWLQIGLQGLRTQREDWLDHYLQAPLWFFALGEGVVGDGPWIGVVMPSVDAVGRYFPLTLALPLQATSPTTELDVYPSLAQWWGRSAHVALQALDADWDGGQFDAALHALFSQAPQQGMLGPTMDVLPEPMQSSWFAHVGEPTQLAYSLQGLPRDATFGMLFGYADVPLVQG